ncbi:type IV secretion system protein [Bartonella choladocola]|nr:type IV secretion system protein [Bartonella choladocola]
MAKIDTVGSGYVQTAYTSLSTPLIITAKLLISISIAWYGYTIIVGISNMALSTIFKKVMIITLVMTAITSWVVYQTYIYDIVIKAPENIGTLLFNAFTTDDQTDVRHALQTAWDTGWKATSAAFAKGGIRSLGAFLVGAILALGTVVFVVGGFIITGMAKVFAYVLLAIGPFFISTLIFEWTRNWFMSWLNALFNVMCILIVGYAVLGFMLGLSWATIQELEATSEDLSLTLIQAAEFLFIGIMSGLAFLQVPSLAAMLAGGIALNAGQSWSYSLTRFGLSSAGKAGRRAAGGTKRAFQRFRDRKKPNPQDEFASKIGNAIKAAIEKDKN